jgi:hypothetical protein
MQNEDTVAKVFARAKKEYEDEGLSALQVLWQEWTSISLANCDDIRSVGLKIMEIQEGFARVGQEHKLPNSHLTLRLLDTLDDRWESWKAAFWANCRKELPIFEDVLLSAEGEGRRLLAQKGRGLSGEVDGVAMYAGGRKRGPTHTRLPEDEAQLRIKQCTHCGKRWHTKEDCWELHPEKKRKYDERKKRQPRGPKTDTGTGGDSVEGPTYANFTSALPIHTFDPLDAQVQRVSF